MNRISLPLSTLFVVAISAMGFLAFFMSQYNRGLFIPAPLEFAPKTASLIIVTGPIRELWSGVESNFSKVIEEEDREGMIATVILDIREVLEDRGTPINSTEDLLKFGIDPERGLVISASPERNQDYILALPIANIDNFKYFFQAGENSYEESECFANDYASASIEGDGQYVVFPDTEWTVIGTNCELVKKTIRDRKSNLSYIRRDDSILKTIRERFGFPLMSGPRLTVIARQLRVSLSPELRGMLAVDLGSDKIQLQGVIGSGVANARIISNLFSPVTKLGNWRRALGPENPIVLVARDENMSEYLSFISKFEGIAESMREQFGGALHYLQQKESVYQLAFSTSQVRDGFAQLVLGISGGQEELHTLVADIQTSLRKNRDRNLLLGLISLIPPDGEGNKVLPDEVSPSDLLAPEPQQLFDQFSLSFGEVDDSLVQIPIGYFDSPSYVQPFTNGTINYLAPAVTDNDINFRINTKSLSESDIWLLQDNRYRLSSLITDDVLWIATDEQDLMRIGTNLSNASQNSGNLPLELPADRAKVQLEIFVPALYEQLLVAEDSDLDGFQSLLLDLRYHPRISGFVSTHWKSNEFYIHAEAAKSPDVGIN